MVRRHGFFAGRRLVIGGEAVEGEAGRLAPVHPEVVLVHGAGGGARDRMGVDGGCACRGVAAGRGGGLRWELVVGSRGAGEQEYDGDEREER
jgi:hypothetical protein